MTLNFKKFAALLFLVVFSETGGLLLQNRLLHEDASIDSYLGFILPDICYGNPICICVSSFSVAIPATKRTAIFQLGSDLFRYPRIHGSKRPLLHHGCNWPHMEGDHR